MKINCKNNIPIWNNPNWNIIRLRGNLYFSNITASRDRVFPGSVSP